MWPYSEWYEQEYNYNYNVSESIYSFIDSGATAAARTHICNRLW